jgi:hypothetical protein
VWRFIDCLSSLKWKLDGDIKANQVHVSQVGVIGGATPSPQNAADGSSGLDCSPACPQPPPGPGEGSVGEGKAGERKAKGGGKGKVRGKKSKAGGRRRSSALKKKARGRKAIGGRRRKGPGGRRGSRGSQGGGEGGRKGAKKGGSRGARECPGGSLPSCVALCPGALGARVFGACANTCGRRC